MAELKKKRKTALSNFTRNLNTLSSLLEDNSPPLLVNPQYDKFKECWEKLEAAHDEYLDNSDIDPDNDQEGSFEYLEAHATKYREIMKLYSAYLKQSASDEEKHLQQKAIDDRKLEEEQRKLIEKEKRDAEIAARKESVVRQFASGKAEFDAFVKTFKQMNVGFKEIVDASDDDFRSSWELVEQEYSSVKEKYQTTISLDHDRDQDATEMGTVFVECESTFLETKKWALAKLNKPIVVVKPPSLNADSVRSLTKREEVILPSFTGDSL